jgi:hypothetical protein
MSGAEHIPPLSVLYRIEALCDEFQREWRAGRRPEIQKYLSCVPASEQTPLVSALIPLDVEYRVQQGESPARDDYLPQLIDGVSLPAELFPCNASTLPWNRWTVPSHIEQRGQANQTRVPRLPAPPPRTASVASK